MPGLPDLRDFVRAEPIPPDATLLVRGGPDSVAKLEVHAQRVHRAFVLDGAPTFGISVFAALDDIGPASFEEILAGKLATYRVVHVVTAGDLVAAGFDVLPTFGRPHVTMRLAALDQVTRAAGAARSSSSQPPVWWDETPHERMSECDDHR